MAGMMFEKERMMRAPRALEGNAMSQIFQGINVVSISVPDLDAAREFYRDVLGLGEPLYDLPDMGWVEFQCGASAGNISVTKAPAGWRASTSTTIVFNVPDCHAAWRELKQRGVRCEGPEEFPGYVTVCSFYDPFGNRLQMCSSLPAESAS